MDVVAQNLYVRAGPSHADAHRSQPMPVSAVIPDLQSFYSNVTLVANIEHRGSRSRSQMLTFQDRNFPRITAQRDIAILGIPGYVDSHPLLVDSTPHINRSEEHTSE